MAYIQHSDACVLATQTTAGDPELEAFVISRLAELVVILFRDYAGADAAAMKDRAEGRAIMLALGDTAADHGRANLTPILHNMAKLIEVPDQVLAVRGRFETPVRCVAQPTYHF